MGVAFYIKLFTRFHASYMEYSGVQTLKAHKSYKIVLTLLYTSLFSIVLEIIDHFIKSRSVVFSSLSENSVTSSLDVTEFILFNSFHIQI